MQKLHKLFISCVSNEFKSYRETLLGRLRDISGFEIETQETFRPYGENTLLKLDDYVSKCDGVLYISGSTVGKPATEKNREALLRKHPAIQQKLNLKDDFFKSLSLTEWECWLAVYHRKKLYIASTDEKSIVDNQIPNIDEKQRQKARLKEHIELLKEREQHVDDKLRFKCANDLIINLLVTVVDNLLRIDEERMMDFTNIRSSSAYEINDLKEYPKYCTSCGDALKYSN